MKDYSTYNAIDFACDDHFLKWVKYPGKSRQTDRFWTEWTARHIEKKEEVEEAIKMILAVIEEKQFVPSENKQYEIWTRLQKSIASDLPEKNPVQWQWKSVYRIAASIILLVTVSASISFWWLTKKEIQNDAPLASIGLDIVKEFNNGSLPKTIVLGDGSSIILKPKSSLEFPKIFETGYREVWLSGEAFFEVAKDAKRPFLVHTDKLITKVLGTSFNIRAFENEGNISVQVKTGKVSVFTEADAQANEKRGDTQLEGVLLIPNQQVLFVREESRMIKSLVENPTLLSAAATQNFVFDDTPLKEVFASIEQAYGVQIIFDEELMANCFLNASLEDMPLYDKMRLICKGIDAHYEILDSHIIVSGKGCN